MQGSQMTATSQFPSLDKFRGVLQQRSALLECRVTEELLSSLQPTPKDAFQRALDIDGAKEHDIHAFVKSLKALKDGNSNLVTKGGLVFLSNTVWQLSFEESEASQATKQGRQQKAEAVQAATKAPKAKQAKKGNQAKGKQPAAEIYEAPTDVVETAVAVGAAAGTRRAKRGPDVAAAQHAQPEEEAAAEPRKGKRGAAVAAVEVSKRGQKAAKPSENGPSEKDTTLAVARQGRARGASKQAKAAAAPPVAIPDTTAVSAPAMTTRRGGKPAAVAIESVPAEVPAAMPTRRDATKVGEKARSQSAAPAPAADTSDAKDGTSSAAKGAPRTTARGNKRAAAPSTSAAAAHSNSVPADAAEAPAVSDAVQAPAAGGARRTGRQTKPTAVAAAAAQAAAADKADETVVEPKRAVNKRVQAGTAVAAISAGKEVPVAATRPVSARRAAKVAAGAEAAPQPQKKPVKRGRQTAAPAAEASAQLPAADSALQADGMPSKRIRKPSVKLNRDDSPVPAAAVAAVPTPTSAQPSKRARKSTQVAPGMSAEDAAAIAAAQNELDMLPRGCMSTRRSAGGTSSAGTASGAAGTSGGATNTAPRAAAGATKRINVSKAVSAAPKAAALDAKEDEEPPVPLKKTARQKAAAERKGTGAAEPAAAPNAAAPVRKSAPVKVSSTFKPLPHRKKQERTSKAAGASESRGKSTSNAKSGKTGSSEEEAGSGARKSTRTPIPKKLFEPDQNFPSDAVVPGPAAAIVTALVATASAAPARAATAVKAGTSTAAASGGKNGAVAKRGSTRRGSATSAGAAAPAPAAEEAHAAPAQPRSRRLSVKVTGGAQAGKRLSLTKRAKRTTLSTAAAAEAEEAVNTGATEATQDAEMDEGEAAADENAEPDATEPAVIVRVTRVSHRLVAHIEEHAAPVLGTSPEALEGVDAAEPDPIADPDAMAEHEVDDVEADAVLPLETEPSTELPPVATIGPMEIVPSVSLHEPPPDPDAVLDAAVPMGTEDDEEEPAPPGTSTPLKRRSAVPAPASAKKGRAPGKGGRIPGKGKGKGKNNVAQNTSLSVVPEAGAGSNGMALDHSGDPNTEQAGGPATDAMQQFEDGENAAMHQSAGETQHHADKSGVGALSGMHDDDVGGLGDMNADAGGCASHLLAQDLPMDALDATVDMMLQQQLDGAPDTTDDKLAEHAMELHGPAGLANENVPSRERGAAASGENMTSGSLMHQEGVQRGAVEQPSVSAQKPPSRSKGSNPRRGSGSSFARVPRSAQHAGPESPVATGVEQAALQFPMSPGVPLIGFHDMQQESSKRSRRRSSLPVTSG